MFFFNLLSFQSSLLFSFLCFLLKIAELSPVVISMYVHTCLNLSQTLVSNLIEGYKVYVGLSAKQLHVVPVALNGKKTRGGGSISSECEAFLKPFFYEKKSMMKEKVSALQLKTLCYI